MSSREGGDAALTGGMDSIFDAFLDEDEEPDMAWGSRSGSRLEREDAVPSE